MTSKAWLAALTLWAIGLQGQASPFDPVTRDTVRPGVICYHHIRYIVVGRRVMEVGSDLFIRPARSGRCDADSLPGDIVLRNHDAEYFLGLRGDLLFIDSGTGPDFRGLIVMDLRTQRRLLQTDYVGHVVAGARGSFEPFGTPRQIMARYTTDLPNAPRGQYVLFQYETNVSGGRQVVETVIPVLEAKRGWRVSGYFIRPDE